VVVDLGTGDGKAVLRRARHEPQTLAIGIDADAGAMREASQRAARLPRRGGLPNALFIAAGAELLPGPLAARADRLTVVLPWGSLLCGLVRPCVELIDGLGRSLRAGGELELLLSVQPTDHSTGMPILDAATVDRLLTAYAECGFESIEARSATRADVERLTSAWAKRLGVPNRRAAWLLRFCRAMEPEPIFAPVEYGEGPSEPAWSVRPEEEERRSARG
jgi:16S rRNA (adenine(1408)-N(1))-methyltransferase